METTILLIDDEVSILKLLSAVLRGAGYQVLTGASVAEGRDILKRNRIDLLVTDINMPEESGFVLIDHVKAHYPKLPIIVATVIDNITEAQQVLESGVYGYLVKPFNKNLVLITVANALRLHELESQQQASRRALEHEHRAIMDNLPMGMLVLGRDMELVEANKRMRSWFGPLCEQTGAGSFLRFVKGLQADYLPAAVTGVLGSGEGRRLQALLELERGTRMFQITVDLIPTDAAGNKSVIIMFEDQTEALTLERELRQAQKLEAIGQLAAGIAHEINTPVQYVGDNIRFLADSFAGLLVLLQGYEDFYQEVRETEVGRTWREAIESLQTSADIDFLREEIPVTVQQSLDGVGRVSNIVRAMKEFSHPGSTEKVQVDISKALQSTITVSRNEWKYGADLQTDFAPDLPLVSCLPAELNQVFLNLIVNAAHAIDARVKNGDFDKGLIRVGTRVEDGQVVIEVADNGTGIPERIRHRIYDPFFTTKAVGKGTGQGLAIARDIVVEKHGGTINCQTTEGEGTTFTIILPVDERRSSEADKGDRPEKIGSEE
ncbi:MAG: response regulator [Desulfofustis sp.]|nr:response regulator [Desulfofustis sp.]